MVGLSVVNLACISSARLAERRKLHRVQGLRSLGKLETLSPQDDATTPRQEGYHPCGVKTVNNCEEVVRAFSRRGLVEMLLILCIGK